MRMTDRGEKQSGIERDILSEVNAHVHEAARRLERTGPDHDHWEFACECGARDCRVQVSLTLAEYEGLRAAKRPVLAPGHTKAGAR
jgi:hypothetical protein